MKKRLPGGSPFSFRSIGPLGYLHAWVETGFPAGSTHSFRCSVHTFNIIIIRPLDPKNKAQRPSLLGL